MLKNILILSILMGYQITWAQLPTPTATQVLTSIHQQYSQRFDSQGRYIDDSQLTEKFKKQQLQAIQWLKQNKLVGSSVQIKNTAMSDLIITVSIVQESNGEFAGLLIERSKYDTPSAEALLRLFNKPILAGGMSVFTFNGNSVIHLQSEGPLDSISGGVIKVTYPKDYNKQKFEKLGLMIQNNQGFKIVQLNGQTFQSFTLDIWYSIFSQNFGVTQITFN